MHETITKAGEKATTAKPFIPAKRPAYKTDAGSPGPHFAGNLAVQHLLRDGLIQAKPTVGPPRDIYEQDADRMADRVMTCLDPGTEPGKCSACAAGPRCPECEATGRIQAQAKPGRKAHMSSGSEATNAATFRSGGQPLSSALRSFFEPHFARDFGAVRVHTDEQAAESARAIQARAYTSEQHMVFGCGEYAPETREGQRLLAHELAHVTQQTGGGTEQVVQRSVWDYLKPVISPLSAVEDKWFDSQGADLARKALAGNFEAVEEALDDVGSSKADNLSDAILHALPHDEELDQIHGKVKGRLLLNRMYDELTSGDVSRDEAEQANRILETKARRTGAEEYSMRTEHAKIFPYRPGGFTVWDDSPIMAKLLPGRTRIWVKLPTRVMQTDMFRAEVKTLPFDTFIGGIELLVNDVIGVKRYDLGGEIEYRPAIYLLQIANASDQNVYSHIQEAVLVVATLGTGSLATRAGSWGVRALLFADRAAFAISVVTTVINEHRGEIIARFGDSGRTFLLWVDRVNSVMAVYGGIRGVMSAVQLIKNLSASYQRWQSFKQTLDLAADEAAIAGKLERETESFLTNVDQARVANDNAMVDFSRAPANTNVPASSPNLGGSYPQTGGASYSSAGPYTGGSAAAELNPSYTPAPTVAPQPRLSLVPPEPAGVPSPMVSPAPVVTPAPISPPEPAIPEPAPVTPSVPIAPGLAAGRKTQVSPYTVGQVWPSPDPSEEALRRGCRATEGPSLGENRQSNCHHAFAQSLSGLSREFVLTNPHGVSASFDAHGRDGVLYEVKTGYRWLVFGMDDEARNDTIERFQTQCWNQLAVAAPCAYPLVWVFNDSQVAAFFRSLLPVPVIYIPFPCTIDSDG